MNSLRLSFSGALALVGLGLAAPAHAADDWCVIVSSAPYSALDKALAKVEASKTAGFPKAAVYDTRAFENLAWGQLAGVAVIDATKAAARDAVKALKKKKIDAFARRCHPLDGSPSPITRKEDLAPMPQLPSEAAVVEEGKDLDYGCFAWSQAQAAAACVVGEISIQGGAKAELSFVGATEPDIGFVEVEPQILDDVPMVPNKAQLADMRAALRGGKYVPLTLPKRKLLSNASMSYAEPRVTFTWKRKVTGTAGDGETGSWSLHSDLLTATCEAERAGDSSAPAATPGPVTPAAVTPAQKGRSVVIFTRDDAEDADPTVTVWAIPGGRYFVLELNTIFGIEGDSGGTTQAYRFDAQTCTVE